MSALSKSFCSRLARASASRVAASVTATPKANMAVSFKPDLASLKGTKNTIIAASPADAIKPFIKSGQNIHLHMAAATPTDLLNGTVELQDGLDNIKFYHMSLDGPLPHLDSSIPEGKFKSMPFFISSNTRPFIAPGRAEFVPAFFSEVPRLYRTGRVPLDIAYINVSPPDENGWCSLGVSVDCCLAAVQTAKHVVAQINPSMPRTHGEGFIHMSAIDSAVEVKTPIYTSEIPTMTEVDHKIGEYCASMIPDGATLQIGIGNIPNAVLAQLGNHKDLGVHTELMSDGCLPLIKSGVINNRRKKVFANKLVTTFITGTRALFDFVDDNPELAMIDVATVNDPSIIGLNPDVIALNSAIEVDLSGQVCADSIGTRMFSGFGGQTDFIRGAALSPGGKPIIAMPSVTAKGQSKITNTLAPGAGVITTRGHVHYVVTEYGIAELVGQSLQERARRLINIAHPDHRDALGEDYRKRFGKSIY